MLAEADLARYAGQFVWLEVNFDDENNSAFFARYGVYATPTFYIIDSQDGKVAASQSGAMSLAELRQFLERGIHGASARRQSPADAALQQGDTVLAKRPEEAVGFYKEALRLAPAGWARRDLAESNLTIALQNSRRLEECAETAVTAATNMGRGPTFGRTIVAGMWCTKMGEAAPWTKIQAAKLKPLAVQALSLASTVRDHRNELYRTLMFLALARGDNTEAARFGELWMKELDAIQPRNREERMAVDIARVEDVQVIGDPRRILPALLASEQALPENWNASLRVAQMEYEANSFQEAVAACDRGLERSPGPAGRSWLLRVKADALVKIGKRTEARRSLEEALAAAAHIPNELTRSNNIRNIEQAIKTLGEH
jgi:hypothetical protein